MSIPSHLPQPRLCNLKKWQTYSGYGFNLHAEKGKPGQYVGKVDPNSPAETGGLGAKYFLVEVNGVNVEELSHQKVVERIKETPNQVTMLVAPYETYKYCKEHIIIINKYMPEVETYTTPDAEPGTTESETIEKEESGPVEQQAPPPPEPSPPTSAKARSDSPLPDHDEPDYAVVDASPRQSAVEKSSPAPSPAPSPQPQRRLAPTPPPPIFVESPRSPSPAAAPAAAPAPAPAASPAASPAARNGAQGSDPVGNISLEEMRAKLGRNKRTQVKMNPSSFSEKSNMFQAL